MKNLIPIGRFSQMTRLSIRMLRHYDDLGLLKPAQVDPDSSYRYYSLAQVADAERIRLLRSLEVPLEEIRSLLSEPDAQAVRRQLEQHKARLEAQVAQYQQVIERLGQLSVQGVEFEYLVRIRSLEPQPILSQRSRTSLAEIIQSMSSIYGELYTAVGQIGIRPAGPPFFMCHEAEFKEEDMDVEVGIPTERLVTLPKFISRELPGGPAAYVLHVGPYDQIGAAYRSLAAWIYQHGHETAGPPRESYLIGKGQVESPAEYRTELIWPIRD